MYCTDCGSKNNEKNHFCNNCGLPIKPVTKTNEIESVVQKKYTVNKPAIILGIGFLVAGFIFYSAFKTDNQIQQEQNDISSVVQSNSRTFYTQGQANVRSCASSSCEVVGQYPANAEFILPYATVSDLPEWVELNWNNDNGEYVIGYINKKVLGSEKGEQINAPVNQPQTQTVTEAKQKIDPVNNNLDSTCLSFYKKMKALDIPPVKTTPVYTEAEQKAIQSAYTGDYDPNLQSVFAKQEEAEKLYLDTLKGNAIQKENLSSKYGFCYEYLSKTYGFIIE